MAHNEGLDFPCLQLLQGEDKAAVLPMPLFAWHRTSSPGWTGGCTVLHLGRVLVHSPRSPSGALASEGSPEPRSGSAPCLLSGAILVARRSATSPASPAPALLLLVVDELFLFSHTCSFLDWSVPVSRLRPLSLYALLLFAQHDDIEPRHRPSSDGLQPHLVTRVQTGCQKCDGTADLRVSVGAITP